MFFGEVSQTCIVCDCGDNFVLEQDYQEHLETSHGIEEILYKCGLCHELFGSEEACTIHLNTHDAPAKTENKKNLLNHVCEVCGKKYASRAALGYHQRLHTGERPYQCAVCPKAFTMPLFLQIHVRTHTGEKPYQCESCSKAFTNKAGLLRHSRVHSGVKPYSCPRCGKNFQQSNSLKLHIRTVHDKLPAPYRKKNKNKHTSATDANAAEEKKLISTDHEYFQTNTASVATGQNHLNLNNYDILKGHVKIESLEEDCTEGIKRFIKIEIIEQTDIS